MGTEGARVVDLRYGRYEGERRGTAASVWALARWSAFAALGARRGWKAKLIPVAVALFALGPAVVVLGVRALLPGELDESLAEVVPFSDYQRQTGVAILIMAAFIGPELLCSDRRDGVLSLYFSTALTPRQYLIGKIGAVVLPLLLVTLVPLLVYWIGIAVFDDDPLGTALDGLPDLLRILFAGLSSAVYFGVLALAISSLTPRRVLAAGGYLALLVASSAVAGALDEAGASDLTSLGALSLIPVEVGARLFPGGAEEVPLDWWAWALAWIVVVGVSLAVLVRRYARET